MTDRKAGEYDTVELGGISVRKIDGFLCEKLGFSEKIVTNSHLYTERDGDFEYTDSVNLDAYFSQQSNATFYLKTVQLDHIYRKVMCAIYSNGATANLECAKFES